MKTIFLSLTLMLTTMVSAQNPDYWYLNGSFDVNKAFDLKDNKRTVDDKHGLDFDFEAGARDRHFGVFMFYGRFDEMGWQNYGAGVDYYVDWFRDYNIELSVGIAYGVIILEDDIRTKEKRRHSFNGNTIRGVMTYWITNNIGLTGRFQYLNRGDLPNKDGILEGSVGITLKFNR